eukprot:1190487-Prorocentrum_minimum.AAC.2
MRPCVGGAGLRVLHAGGQLTEGEVKDIVLSDLALAGGSAAAVAFALLYHTRSVWVVANAMLGESLSPLWALADGNDTDAHIIALVRVEADLVELLAKAQSGDCT